MKSEKTYIVSFKTSGWLTNISHLLRNTADLSFTHSLKRFPIVHSLNHVLDFSHYHLGSASVIMYGCNPQVIKSTKNTPKHGLTTCTVSHLSIIIVIIMNALKCVTLAATYMIHS